MPCGVMASSFAITPKACFFSCIRRHTRCLSDWSSDVCSSDLLTYHRADAGGRLVQSEVIEVPGPTMIHDFAITERNVVFMDLPVVFDLELAMSGTIPYRWKIGRASTRERRAL